MLNNEIVFNTLNIFGDKLTFVEKIFGNSNACKIHKYQMSIPRIAKFHKVSYEQFKNDLTMCHFNFSEEEIKQMYEDIKLPVRGTKGSAGYDFFAPFTFKPVPGEGIEIPSGIKCEMARGWFMGVYPRSGQGNRSGVHLYDTTAIIDQDYFNSEKTEGHIIFKITSKDEGEVIHKGVGFCQGIFTLFGITLDDNVTTIRTGGLGSTTKM